MPSIDIFVGITEKEIKDTTAENNNPASAVDNNEADGISKNTTNAIYTTNNATTAKEGEDSSKNTTTTNAATAKEGENSSKNTTTSAATEKKGEDSSTGNINNIVYSPQEKKIYEALNLMRRVRLLEEYLQHMLEQVSETLIFEPVVDDSFRLIERKNTLFMELLDVVKFSTFRAQQPTHDPVVMAFIRKKLTCPHLLRETFHFFHEQWHQLHDICVRIEKMLTTIFKEEVEHRYQEYIEHRHHADPHPQRFLRSLYLGMGIYVGQMQTILLKCTRLNTGCATCCQRNLGTIRYGTFLVAGVAADILRMAACIGRHIEDNKPDCNYPFENVKNSSAHITEESK